LNNWYSSKRVLFQKDLLENSKKKQVSNGTVPKGYCSKWSFLKTQKNKTHKMSNLRSEILKKLEE